MAFLCAASDLACEAELQDLVFCQLWLFSPLSRHVTKPSVLQGMMQQVQTACRKCGGAGRDIAAGDECQSCSSKGFVSEKKVCCQCLPLAPDSRWVPMPPLYVPLLSRTLAEMCICVLWANCYATAFAGF